MSVVAARPAAPPIPVAQPYEPVREDKPFDAARDVQVIEDTRQLPEELRGSIFDVATSSVEDTGGEGFYAAQAVSEPAYRVLGTGPKDAMVAAQNIAKEHDALAVVQSNDGASTYLLPLGIWTPVDESMFTFDEMGGAPHDDGPDEYVHVTPQGNLDVKAIMFDGGSSWVDFSGKPVTGSTSVDVLQRYGSILDAAGAWRTDASNPRQLQVRFLDNGSGQWADRLLRDSIEGVDLVLQTRSGKPLPAGSGRYAEESEGVPSAFLRAGLPGVVGASVGAGDASIPSITYTDSERSAALLRSSVDTDTLLDGKRRWEIRALEG